MMTFFLFEYLQVFCFLLFAFLLSFIILIAAYFFSFQNNTAEKLSAYECGFDPFEDSRNQFDIRFYLIALLFLVFDLEAVFLFPWIFVLKTTGFFGFFIMIDFFFELVVGFYYVWVAGALEWS